MFLTRDIRRTIELVDPVLIDMKPVIADLIGQPKQDQGSAGHANHQARNIDKGKALPAHQAAPGRPEIIFKHTASTSILLPIPNPLVFSKSLANTSSFSIHSLSDFVSFINGKKEKQPPLISQNDHYRWPRRSSRTFLPARRCHQQ